LHSFCITIMTKVGASKASKAQDLIYSSSYVHDDVSVRDAYAWFVSQPDMRCIGVVSHSLDSAGLVTREAIYRYLHDRSDAGKPVSSIMTAKPFTVTGDTPVNFLLESFLSAQSKSPHFYDDIVVFNNGRFAGLISVRDFLCEQASSVLHRLTAMEAQQAALIRQNKELFEQSFRHGQKETQYRSFLDHVPIPIIVFDAEGKLVDASARFFRLSGYSPRQQQELTFQKIFTNDYLALKNAATDYGTDTEMQQQIFHPLNMVCLDKPPMTVQSMVEQSTEWGYVVISIMGLGEGNSPATSSLAEVVLGTSPNPPGKITQAIKVRVRDEQMGGLASRVANNLVDREAEMDRLMSKLEKIIEVAQIVERQPEPSLISATPTEPPTDDERQHLNGNLADFSVIDLCQILIQGQKTGQLLLFEEGEEELHAYIYFTKGQFVHAKFRASPDDIRAGEEVLSRILSLKKGKFDFIFNKEPSAITIHGDAMQLLMEACRQADEGSV